MSQQTDLFGAPAPTRPEPARKPSSSLCPRTGRNLKCDCGRLAVIGRGAIVRRGIVGTWTCGRVECAS